MLAVIKIEKYQACPTTGSERDVLGRHMAMIINPRTAEKQMNTL